MIIFVLFNVTEKWTNSLTANEQISAGAVNIRLKKLLLQQSQYHGLGKVQFVYCKQISTVTAI